MVGDKLVFTYRQRLIARKIYESVMANEYSSIICIGGGSGTGKTEVSVIFQEMLFKQNLTSVKLSLDDYYYLEPNVRNERRANKGISSVGINEINWDRVNSIKEAFSKHTGFTQQEYNKYLGNNQVNLYENSVDNPVNYLVIEGLYANYIKGDCNFYLDANPDMTLEWRMKRGKECETNEFRQRVVIKEYEEARSTLNNVDVVFDYSGEIKEENNGR